MPPSSRRGRGRKVADAHDVSDAETPESIATPSRNPRKRTRATEAPASNGRAATRRKVRENRAVDREDTEGTEAGEQSDAETEPATPSEIDVIAKLKVSDKLVHATEDFANDLLEGRENVPGYGKIAGRHWTYIIKDVEVNIGRPEQHEKAAEPGSSQALEPGHKSNISIDLGPDRQISRLHAVIAYESESGQWSITVNGRNGLRVDTVLLKRGQKTYLRSGSVIDINGTQMAFITTAVNGNDGPTFADAIIRQTYASEDEEPEGGANGRAQPGAHGHPPPQSSARRGQQDPSSFSDGQPNQRFHPHSQAGLKAAALPPGTPTRTHQLQQPRSKQSPAMNGYARGVMIESTESIDYSADAAKDLKPPHSYAQLIGMAILSTPEQQMTLNNIYKWITANYAFYRFNTGGWQNSIRHNLSLNKAFEKIARRTDEPGKGMKWMISPKERETFLSQGMKGCRRPNPLPRGPSNGSDPSSPAHFGNSSVTRPGPGSVKAPPSSKVEGTMSPPLASYAPAYPKANEAYTPDRGSRRQHAGGSFEGNGQDLEFYPPSAKSTMNHLTAAANAAGSPPSLYINDDGRTGPLDTPFPIRSSQKLAPPSTLQRPSAFMEFSSPAPFWKFGSTPLRPLTDISPLKTPFSTFRPLGFGGEVAKKEEEDEKEDKVRMQKAESVEIKTAQSPQIQSSSPPRPASASGTIDGSPTRTVSRPNTSHERTKSDLGRFMQLQQHQQQQQEGTPGAEGREMQATQGEEVSRETDMKAPQQPASRSMPQSNGYSTTPPVGSYNAPNINNGGGMNLYGNDADEEEGIDLVR
ncbi:transcription factor [Zalaria obscura]|uniref:Transcription factor n=1 Tax=Zalaria obscura TaxID=2024903 RepID=A0ACC3SH91_9PEZI